MRLGCRIFEGAVLCPSGLGLLSFGVIINNDYY